MRLASIDYGLTVGLAIAECEVSKTKFVLKQYLLASIEDSDKTVLNAVKSSRARCVVLEHRPQAADKVGLASYERLYNGLLDMGFTISNLFALNALKLIGPGTWKPFMKVHRLYGNVMNSWHIDSQHESDALAMLYYAVRFTVPPSVQVVYG